MEWGMALPQRTNNFKDLRQEQRLNRAFLSLFSHMNANV